MGKAYSSRQRSGGQFSGNVQQNTVQPRESWDDLTPKEKAKLIKTTGQQSDPAALARARNFMGQNGEKPRDPDPPRYKG